MVHLKNQNMQKTQLNGQDDFYIFLITKRI